MGLICLGMGGSGGGPLGGCSTWAWGIPSTSDPIVAAGNEGNACAMKLVATATRYFRELNIPGGLAAEFSALSWTATPAVASAPRS